MKRGIAFIGLLLVVSLFASSFVAAQEDVEVDAVTEVEIEAIVDDSVVADGYHHGAEMRFLQLERAILRMINRGEVVVEYLQEKGEDTSELEGILDEMRLLADEAGNADFTQDKETLVKLFLDIKQDVRNLMEEFRDIVHELLEESDLSELRVRLSESESDSSIDDLTARIGEARCKFRSYRVERILSHMDMADDDLVSEIRSCSLTVNDISEKLKEKRMEISEEKKSTLKTRLQSDIEARVDVKTDRIEEFKGNRLSSVGSRLERRAQELERIGKDVRARAVLDARAALGVSA